MEKQIRVLIGGLGNAGRPMIDLFISEQSRIARDYGIHFQIIGVADSKGAAICPDGIPYEHIAQAKDHCGTVAMISGNGHPQMTALQMIEACDADIYVDGLPPFLPTGEPGTSNIRAALQKGMHVVTANKTVGIPAVVSKCENSSNSSGYAGLKYCGKSFPISIFIVHLQFSVSELLPLRFESKQTDTPRNP